MYIFSLWLIINFSKIYIEFCYTLECNVTVYCTYVHITYVFTDRHRYRAAACDITGVDCGV